MDRSKPTFSPTPASIGMAIVYLSVVVLASPPGYAQDSGDKRASRSIEEVIVTARRVEESLQDTPVSVAAFQQADLERIGFSEPNDIARFTPNLDMRKQIGSSDNLALSIRGMSVTSVAMTVEPSVAVYLDGMYLARSTGLAFDIIDVERIEVLRGPQGTLFGRNTIGGAINIISEKPRGEFALFQQVTAGSHGRQRIATRLDTPTAGNLSAKLSFLRFEHDGFVDSRHTGEDLGQRESDNFRLAVNWTPSDTFNVGYSFALVRRESNPNNSQLVEVRSAFADPDGEFYGGAFYETLAANASTDRLDKLSIGRATGMPSFSDIDMHTLTGEWELTPSLTAKSITGYLERDSLDWSEFGTVGAPADGSVCSGPGVGTYDFLTGTCAEPVPAGQLISGFQSPGQEQLHEQRSQEFQFIGQAFEERLRFTTGLYYFQEEASEVNTDRDLVIAAPIAALGFSAATGVPEEAVVPQNRGNSLLIQLTDSSYTTENLHYAAYGDFTYTVLPRLDVTLGLRYAFDEKETTLTRSLDGELKTVNDKEDWSSFNPALTVNYRWSDNLRTYAKAVTGYRSGGHDIRVTTERAFKTPFDEENVISYEIGWKTDLLERSLRFNGALYYADYQDQQISSLKADEEGAGVQTLNAAEAVHSGIELEATWLPFAGMRIVGSYAYLNVDFKEFLTERTDPATGMPANPGTTEDISDIASSPYSPENSASLAVEYQLEPWQWGQLILRIDANYTDETSSGAQPSRFTRSKAHTVTNVGATLSDIPVGRNGTLRLAAWVRNVTDEEVREFGADFGVLGFFQASYMEVRNYGVDLVYEFGR